MSDDRFEKLTELGFDFTSGKDKEASSSTLDLWATRVSELKAFKEANGHADVPGSYALNRGLGTWVHQTRVAYSEGKLTDEQTQELKELEFEFKLKKAKPRQARVWERNFAMLADYKARNDGSFKGICAHNPAIGKWLKRQKYYYRENNLKKERIDRLRELGVAFEEARVRKSPVKLPWETQYEALVGESTRLSCVLSFYGAISLTLFSRGNVQNTKMFTAIQTCHLYTPRIKAYTIGSTRKEHPSGAVSFPKNEFRSSPRLVSTLTPKKPASKKASRSPPRAMDF